MKEKLKAVREAIRAIEKQFGKGAIMQLGDHEVTRVPSFSSGCVALDEALGCGGYPHGRIVEIYGPEASGKTTLTLHAIAECQRAGGIAAFIDAEHALDVQYARALGVRTEELLVSQPDTGEQALDIVETLVNSAAINLIVVDSVAALVPRAELEGDMGDSHVGLQARLMSQALRKLTATSHKTETTLMFINQLRMKIGVKFGSPETTTGGNALKYYASMRLDVRRIGAVKSGEDVIGNRTRVKVVKNKLAPPFKQVEFDIRYGEGVDAVGVLLDAAVDSELVQKNGAYYAIDGKTFAQGRERARQHLKADDALCTRLRQELEAKSVAAEGAQGQPAKAQPATAQPDQAAA